MQMLLAKITPQRQTSQFPMKRQVTEDRFVTIQNRLIELAKLESISDEELGKLLSKGLELSAEKFTPEQVATLQKLFLQLPLQKQLTPEQYELVQSQLALLPQQYRVSPTPVKRQVTEELYLKIQNRLTQLATVERIEDEELNHLLKRMMELSTEQFTQEQISSLQKEGIEFAHKHSGP